MHNKLKTSFISFLNENRLNNPKYKNCLTSDIFRMEIIENFFEKVKNDNTYNINEPDYFKLIDDWDGYDDQVYIQNKLNNNEFIFFEGWVRSCWDAVFLKPEYKNLSKQEVIESIIQKRFPRIGDEFGYEIVSYDYFLYKSKYIMKVVFKKS